jgi:DNA-binding Lrp family transcriptional regulator
VPKGKEREFIEYFEHRPEFVNLRSIEGDFDLTVSAIVEDPGSLADSLTRLKDDFGEHIHRLEVMPIIRTYKFHGDGKVFSFSQKSPKKKKKIDEIDKRIIEILSRQGRIQTMKLAAICKSNAKKLAYRIKRMEKEGTIVSHTYEQNFEKSGMIPHELDIDMKRFEDIPNAISFFAKTGRGTFAYMLLGRYNMSLEFYVTAEEMMEILGDFKRQFSGKYNDYDLSHITEERVIGWSPFSSNP